MAGESCGGGGGLPNWGLTELQGNTNAHVTGFDLSQGELAVGNEIYGTNQDLCPW